MNRPLRYSSKSNRWNRVKIISLTLSILSLSACQSAPTLEKLPRTLTVSGKGDVSISTTIMEARLGVEVQGKTSQEVQQQVAQRSSAVVKLLKSRQVEELKTTGITLAPNYSFKDGKQTLNGYIGTNIVSFRTGHEKAGALLDEAIKAGATRIDGVNLVAADEAIAQAQQEAIKEASEDAQKQAAAALGALALNQREIVSIQINGVNPPQPVIASEQALLSVRNQAAANTPVVGGEQKVLSSVTLQIRY
ncbi:SIMPL domain-containing protein [Coleofasciculus sp. FACHB-1120]|uniref:SIMPL domain-containing protein n=1 Tax=Coleofasciculus sp. FACHB-1120 TaxID=2692783 RepID=UPI0016892F94|nr:SIMPL domain-containing protein [Coleofasciculus sp. FACHB-1120]MBD2742760.1 SIMPL domain-containing protein [Coleofasciculus sp. FACHB-1120]